MGRPSTKPKKLKDGFYLEVRNKGSKMGMKIHRDTEEEMLMAAKDYGRSKEVIIMGESKDGKWVNEPVNTKKRKKK